MHATLRVSACSFLIELTMNTLKCLILCESKEQRNSRTSGCSLKYMATVIIQRDKTRLEEHQETGAVCVCVLGVGGGGARGAGGGSGK